MTLTKEKFHKLAKKSFREVAKLLGLEKGEFDLRTNPAGIAMLGETTLHTDQIYIQAGGSYERPYLMYRVCNGRKDYCGRTNNYLPIEAIQDPVRIADAARSLIERTENWQKGAR